MASLTNRPAFPVAASAVEHGVTMRDWFAGLALQGVVAKGLEVMGDRVISEEQRNEILARRAYQLADAMLKVSCETANTATA